jgi:hypothetical protein
MGGIVFKRVHVAVVALVGIVGGTAIVVAQPGTARSGQALPPMIDPDVLGPIQHAPTVNGRPALAVVDPALVASAAARVAGPGGSVSVEAASLQEGPLNTGAAKNALRVNVTVRSVGRSERDRIVARWRGEVLVARVRDDLARNGAAQRVREANVTVLLPDGTPQIGLEEGPQITPGIAEAQVFTIDALGEADAEKLVRSRVESAPGGADVVGLTWAEEAGSAARAPIIAVSVGDVAAFTTGPMLFEDGLVGDFCLIVSERPTGTLAAVTCLARRLGAGWSWLRKDLRPVGFDGA